FEPRHSGHLDVGEEDVRLLLVDRGQSLFAILGHSNHLDVRLEVEEAGERSPHHGLVLGEDDSDHEVLPPNGMSIRSSVPPALPGPKVRVPPAAMTRSRIPWIPEPDPLPGPIPSSVTVSDTRPSWLSIRTSTLSALAWRRTLVTASRNPDASTFSTEGARS